MDAEDLGVKLGSNVIEIAVNAKDELIPDISKAVGKNPINVFIEYIHLLLWLAWGKVAFILTPKYAVPAIKAMHGTIFYFLEESGFKIDSNQFGKYQNERYDVYNKVIDSEKEDDPMYLVIDYFFVCCGGNGFNISRIQSKNISELKQRVMGSIIRLEHEAESNIFDF